MGKVSANYEDFEKILEILVEDLACDQGRFKNVPLISTRMEKVVRYCVLPNVKTSGYLVAQSFAEIYGSSIKSEQLHQAYVLGWCWQMLQTFFAMMDQFLLDEPIHFGRETWFHQNEKHPLCMNDTVLMEQSTYYLLRKYFGHLPVYPEILEYFSKVSHEYFLGQSLEHQLSNNDDYDMNHFTISNRLVCVRKGNFKYRYCGPIQVALILAAYPRNDGLWDSVENIGERFTEYLALKHDLGDMIGKNEANAKLIDQEIKQGKCTWLLMKANELATEAQWYTIKLYYGKCDIVSVATVKGLYRQLGVPTICHDKLQILLEKLKVDIGELAKQRRNIGKKLEQMVDFFQKSEHH